MRTTIVTRTLNATLTPPSYSVATSSRSRASNTSRLPSSVSASPTPTGNLTDAVAIGGATPTDAVPQETGTTNHTATSSDNDGDDGGFAGLTNGKSSETALGYLAFVMLAIFIIGGGIYFWSRRRRKAIKSSRRRRGRTALRRDVELGRWRVASLWRTRADSGASTDPLPEYQGKLPTYREMVQEIRAPQPLVIARDPSPGQQRRDDNSHRDNDENDDDNTVHSSASSSQEQLSTVAPSMLEQESAMVSPQTTGSAPSFAAVTLARLQGENTGSTSSSATNHRRP